MAIKESIKKVTFPIEKFQTWGDIDLAFYTRAKDTYLKNWDDIYSILDMPKNEKFIVDYHPYYETDEDKKFFPRHYAKRSLSLIIGTSLDLYDYKMYDATVIWLLSHTGGNGDFSTCGLKYYPIKKPSHKRLEVTIEYVRMTRK